MNWPMNRRSFFYAAGAAAVAFNSGALERVKAAASSAQGRPAGQIARDEDFWHEIRHAFTIDRTIINLNNGGVSPAPRVVQQSMDRYLQMTNMAPVHYMWKSGYPLYSSCEPRYAGASHSGGRGGCRKTFQRIWWSSPNGLPPSEPVVSICSMSAGPGVSFAPIVRPPRAGQQPARLCTAARAADRPLRRRERSCTTRGCR